MNKLSSTLIGTLLLASAGTAMTPAFTAPVPNPGRLSPARTPTAELHKGEKPELKYELKSELKYELKLVQVADAKPNQFVWMIKNRPSIVYQSLASPSLRGWVDDLPARSLIEFDPGCLRIGGEPMAQVPAFKAYCESKKVKFDWIPSG